MITPRYSLDGDKSREHTPSNFPGSTAQPFRQTDDDDDDDDDDGDNDNNNSYTTASANVNVILWRYFKSPICERFPIYVVIFLAFTDPDKL